MNTVRVLWSARRRYQVGYHSKPHQHNIFHYIYILDGNGTVTINKQLYKVKNNTLYTTPVNTIHDYKPMLPKGIHTIELKFIIDDPEIKKKTESLEYEIEDPSGVIRDNLSSIITEGINAKPFHARLINLKTEELILKLIRGAKTETVAYQKSVSKPVNKHLREAIAYMEKNYAETIDLNDLADIACYTASYFCTLFREEMGKSPINYLISTRIENAKTLFSATDMNVSEVAYAVGFDSIPYFSRCFAQRVGKSPKNFRDSFKDDVYIHFEKDPQMLS